MSDATRKIAGYRNPVKSSATRVGRSKAAAARAMQVETGGFRCKREAFIARLYLVDPAL
jgi:hypothetical protein